MRPETLGVVRMLQWSGEDRPTWERRPVDNNKPVCITFRRVEGSPSVIEACAFKDSLE